MYKNKKKLYATLIIINTKILFGLNFSKTIHNNVNYIYATGIFEFGDTQKLKNILPMNSNQTIVVFNSRGGIMSESIDMGYFLKKNHIGTAVKPNGICASSCAFAFLGGTDKNNNALRILPKKSKLGYHTFYYRNKTSFLGIRRDYNRLIKFIKNMNIPESLKIKIFKVRKNQVYWVQYIDIKKMGIKRDL